MSNSLRMLAHAIGGYQDGSNRREDREQAKLEREQERAARAKNAEMQAWQFARMQDQATREDAKRADISMAGPEDIATTLRKHGDYQGAVQMETHTRQGKVADLQLTQAQEAQVRQRYEDDLRGVNSFQDMASFISKSKGDGAGGSLQATAVPSKDGKTITIQGSDGSTVQFENTPQGLLMAKSQMSKSVSPLQMLQHFESRADKEYSQGMQEKTFKLHERQASASMANMAEGRRLQGMQMSALQDERAAKRAASEAEAKVPPAVKAAYGTIDTELKSLTSAMNKSMAEGTWDEKSAGAQSLMLRQRELSMKASALLSPYLPDSGKAQADPLGLLKPQQATQPQPKAVPQPQASMSAPAQPFGGDVRLAQRIAHIQGHANQKEAIAYLESLKREPQEVDTSFGFGVQP